MGTAGGRVSSYINDIRHAVKHFFTVRLPSPANAGQHAREGPPERAHGVQLPAAGLVPLLYNNRAHGPWPVVRGPFAAMRYARPVVRCPVNGRASWPVVRGALPMARGPMLASTNLIG
jgi:hypothetical protein